MSDPRIEIEDLGTLAALPGDDPRIRALESSPRARAQLRAYREFLAAGIDRGDARFEAARAHLQEVIEREIGVSLTESNLPAAGSARGAPERSRGGGFLRALFAPGLRPVLAVLALVIAGGIWMTQARRNSDREPLMRGPAPAPTEGIASRAQAGADGSVRLSWAPVPEAERYAVVFLSPGLTEIARVGDLREPHLDLGRAGRPAGLPKEGEVLWRVQAFRGTDEIARSQTLPLTLP